MVVVSAVYVPSTPNPAPVCVVLTSVCSAEISADVSELEFDKLVTWSETVFNCVSKATSAVFRDVAAVI